MSLDNLTLLFCVCGFMIVIMYFSYKLFGEKYENEVSSIYSNMVMDKFCEKDIKNISNEDMTKELNRMLDDVIEEENKRDVPLALKDRTVQSYFIKTFIFKKLTLLFFLLFVSIGIAILIKTKYFM